MSVSVSVSVGVVSVGEKEGMCSVGEAPTAKRGVADLESISLLFPFSRPLSSSNSLLLLVFSKWRARLLAWTDIIAILQFLMQTQVPQINAGTRRSSAGGARPRVCLHCGRSFRRTEHLERHVRTRKCCLFL